MEEYIKKLLEQVRFEKAHKAIAYELRAHIEDQIEVNISDGMEKEAAEKRAVEDMGDPVEAGIALDKVHRPQIAWELVLATIGVGLIGTIIQIFIINDTPMLYYAKQMGYISVDSLNGYSFILSTVVGIVIMLSVYLLDYTTFSKCSSVIATIFIIVYLISYLPLKLYWLITAAGTGMDLRYSDYPQLFLFLGEIGLQIRIYNGMLLWIPLYAGIIYKYRGQGYKALFKSLLWMLLPLMHSVGTGDFVVNYVTIAGSMLIQLSVAIKKGWIKVRKAPVLTTIWSVFVVSQALNIRSEFAKSINISVHMPLDKTWIMKKLVDSMYLFGGSLYKGWGDVHIPANSFVPDPDGAFVLTYISTTWGAAAGVAVSIIVIGLIVCGLVAMSRCKNQLGCVMGMGCIAWLAANAIINILGSFGILPYNCSRATFLPFISSSAMSIYSYVALGILLSIYKYKNAYAEHVDISLRAGLCYFRR